MISRIVVNSACARSFTLFRMTAPIISVLLLASTLAVHAASEAGIIKGADQFEFVYHVKLPEITGEARIWLPVAKTDAWPSKGEMEP